MPVERLTFEKGVLESLEASQVPPGFLAACQNLVPEPSGGLRARPSWLNASTTSAPATRDVKGIGIQRSSTAVSTVSRVRSISGSAAAGVSSVAYTFGSAGSAGNLYIAVVTVHSTASPATVTGIAAVASGWTVVGQSASIEDGNTLVTAVLWRTASGHTSGNFDLTGSGSGSFSFVAAEYSGLNTTDPFDKIATNTGIGTGSTQLTVDSGTTPVVTNAGELAVAGFGITPDASTAVSLSNPGQGFTEIVEVTNVNRPTTTYLEKPLLSSSSVRATADSSSFATSVKYTGIVATFKAATAATTTIDNYVVANKSSSTEFKLYTIPRASLAAGTWTLADTVSGLANTTLPVAFANGLGVLLYTHPSFATTRSLTGTTAAAVTGSPVGNAIAFHRGRFYVITGTRLRYSEINDPTNWPEDNFLEVGQDDGDIGYDILSFGGQLFIAKRYSLWLLDGSGPDNYVLDGPFPGDGYPGRCLCPTPFGVFVAGEKRAFLWGDFPEEIQKLLETSYSLSGSFVTTACNDNTIRVKDQGASTEFCFNVLNGTWWKEHVATQSPQTLFSDKERLLMGPSSGTTVSLLMYRSEPGTRERDALMAETFSFTTAEMWRQGPQNAITPLALYLTLRKRGSGTATLTFTPTYNGTAETETEPNGDVRTITLTTAGTSRHRLSLGRKRGIYSVQVSCSATVASDQTAAFDIEDMRLGYDVEDRE